MISMFNWEISLLAQDVMAIKMMQSTVNIFIELPSLSHAIVQYL